MGAGIISDGSTVLFRQVHPDVLKPDGNVSSAAFVPTPNDQGKLSTRHQRIGAQRAYEEHLALGLKTEGSWAVQVSEVHENGIVAIDDEHEDGAPEGHVSIDYNTAPTGVSARRIAKSLARRANARGRLHP